MRISASTDSLKKTKWYEFLVRFALGGLITAIAGLIAKKFGPAVGGLFLAFPAIFPASATLIEKHEKQKKEEKGLHGTRRGRLAAAADSAGAVLGSIGLMVFAIVVWRLLPERSAVLIILGATVAWAVTSFLLWLVREHI